MKKEEELKKLFLVGASTAAKDTFDVIDDINRRKREWEIIGLIDDNPGLLGSTWHNLKVKGGIEYLKRLKNTSDKYVISGIGKPQWRAMVINKILNRNYKFPNIIHPTAFTSRYLQIGKGNIISHGVTIGVDARIGDFNFFNKGCQVAHDVKIGNFCSIQPGALLVESVNVKSFAYVGAGAIIMNYVTLGKGCVIGAGAVVNQDIPPGVVAVGIPARVIKKVE